jgi:hypothetical protein
VQIITNQSFETLSENQAKDFSFKMYSKIYGSEENKAHVQTESFYLPSCYIRYNVSFDTNTSIGCVDSYRGSGQIIMDGVTGTKIDEDVAAFYFSNRFDVDKIIDKDQSKAKHFEFTENDIEEHAINSITEEHTHEVRYTGNNNVSYNKICSPKRRDIDLKEFIPIYMPMINNKIKIKNLLYTQNFYAKGEHNKLFKLDELKKCKICDAEEETYDLMSVCLECGRVVCSSHIKIDYLDKKTSICTIHAKPVKIFLENKYFARKETVKMYQEWLASRNFIQKLYEDKIALASTVIGVLVLIYLIFSLIR